MPLATHIIRFIAVEDGQLHLGQPTDISRDVGLATYHQEELKAYLINGDIYNPELTSIVLTVRQLLAPIQVDDCLYVRCMGLNYSDHASEVDKDVPAAPILFTKPRTSITGPFPATIPIPLICQDGSSDYEGELCVVIGKTGRNIPEQRALDFVLGFTAGNDVSSRKLQNLTPQWCFSKGMDGSCPLGPMLVKTSAIVDPQNLRIQTLLNGDVLQDDITSNMIFSIKHQISYLSQGTTLERGSIIMTGTPSGIGSRRTPRVVLGDTDDIRVHIENIGTLINKVDYTPW